MTPETTQQLNVNITEHKTPRDSRAPSAVNPE